MPSNEVPWSVSSNSCPLYVTLIDDELDAEDSTSSRGVVVVVVVRSSAKYEVESLLQRERSTMPNTCR